MKHRILTLSSLTLLLQAGASQGATQASLSGTLTTGAQSDVNLTTTGQIDWKVWGQGTSTSLSGSDGKSGGSGISSLTRVGELGTTPLRGLGQFSPGSFPSFEWVDGTNTGTASGVIAGLQNEADRTAYAPNPKGSYPEGLGFSFTVAGSDTLSRIVDLYFGTHQGTTTVTATLPGAEPVVFTLGEPGVDAEGRVSFEFLTNSPSDVLTISAVMTSATYIDDMGGIPNNQSFSNTYFHAAALRDGVITGTGGGGGLSAIPEPGSTLALAGLLGGGMFLRRRKGRVG